LETEKPLNFTVPLTLYNALDAEASRVGQTKTALIRWILYNWLEKTRNNKEVEEDAKPTANAGVQN
jgi:predicted DNA-binding protein